MKLKSGNTPLIRDFNLSDKYGFSIFIKDESKNPFGTYKDRKSEFIIEKAKKDKIDTLVIITSGNAGYSLGRFSENKGFRVVSIIDDDVKESIKDKVREYSEVIDIDLSHRILKTEEAISLARKTKDEVILDVTNGIEEAYQKIVEEVKSIKPTHIIMPVGSGEAFVGVYEGIKKNRLKTKLIGVGVIELFSFADKLSTPYTPYDSKIKSICSQGNEVIKLNEKEIKDNYEKYKNKFDIEPSSSVVFTALDKLKFKKDDKIILVNSGKGLDI